MGRAVQGVGGALSTPTAMTLLMMLSAHDPKKLGKAMALYGKRPPQAVPPVSSSAAFSPGG